jgi:aminoglycoside 6'-N-acetyltransferase-1b/aminoglycoside 6'-N-acetyltransferase-2
VRALAAHLFADPAVTAIQTDPAPDNRRAVRCYEKAGFVPHGNVTTPDGPALYMLLTRQAFAARDGAATPAAGPGGPDTPEDSA